MVLPKHASMLKNKLKRKELPKMFIFRGIALKQPLFLFKIRQGRHSVGFQLSCRLYTLDGF